MDELPPSNFDKWQSFMSNCRSPQQYIDWGFYYMVAAALQRRVWIGSELNPTFANIYVVPVGKASLGKGQVIGQVAMMLRHHKLEKLAASNGATPGTEKKGQDQFTAEQVEELLRLQSEAQKLVDEQNEGQGVNGRKKNLEEPLLFPVGADCTTYESLTNRMAKSVRRIQYHKWDEKFKRNLLQTYSHCSLAFVLEEISSLFRKHTEDVSNFLLNAYDCKDYTYETKTAGTDHIKKMCLNFFGGTTPEFMQQVFSSSLLTNGFSSRTFFIFETRPRFYSIIRKEYTPEQMLAREHLLKHLKFLGRLYGQCNFTDETWKFLDDWWKKQESDSEWRTNKSPKMEPYYGRKDNHIIKLSIAHHFAEHPIVDDVSKVKYQIPHETVLKAMAFVEKAEHNMHIALNFGGGNPKSQLGRRIGQYIDRVGGVVGLTYGELLAEFWDDGTEQDIKDSLTYLEGINVIEQSFQVKEGKVTKAVYRKVQPKEPLASEKVTE